MRPRHRDRGPPNPRLGRLLDVVHLGVPHPAALESIQTHRGGQPSGRRTPNEHLWVSDRPPEPPKWHEALRNSNKPLKALKAPARSVDPPAVKSSTTAAAAEAAAAVVASTEPAFPDWARHASGAGVHLDDASRLKREKSAAMRVLRQMIKSHRTLFGTIHGCVFRNSD